MNWTPGVQIDAPEVPIIEPSIHEAADAMGCVRQLMRKEAHIMRMGKIIMPEGYVARKAPYKLTHQDPRVSSPLFILSVELSMNRV